ncbi:MAG: SDR family oxidoreductase [Hyphomicrobiales bacterium]
MTPRRAALVTGAARRIGRDIALHLAASGWDIGLHYANSKDEAEATAREIVAAGAACRLYAADLADAGAAAPLVDRFVGDFARAQLLVNSAAIFERDTLEDFGPDLWRRHMDLNTLAPLLLSKRFHEKTPGKGCIVNILDQKVGSLTPDYFSYTLSKCALADATRMMAMAMAPKTRVNAVAPGLVLVSGDLSQQQYERLHVRTPLGVGPEPAEIAGAVAWFAGTPSVTGQILTIDGGRHMMRDRPHDDLPKD